jgi:hypothetical protein
MVPKFTVKNSFTRHEATNCPAVARGKKDGTPEELLGNSLTEIKQYLSYGLAI